MFNPLASDKVDRIEFPDDNWVDIKERMNTEDFQLVSSAYVIANTKARNLETGDVSLSTQEGNFIAMERCIKAWSFKDEKGKVLPITRKTLKELDYAITYKLIYEINQRNPLPKV